MKSYVLRIIIEGGSVISHTYPVVDVDKVNEEIAENCRLLVLDGVFEGEHYYPGSKITKIVIQDVE